MPQYAFIPKRLEVPDKLEYSHFPASVLFLSLRSANGRLQAGRALYEPDLPTYRKEGSLSSMCYRNVYGDDCYLRIDYDEQEGRYRGEKFINGQLAGAAFSSDNWESFFTHLTILGLAEGEKCRFDDAREEILQV